MMQRSAMFQREKIKKEKNTNISFTFKDGITAGIVKFQKISC